MTTFKNQGIVIHEDISDVGISLTPDISLQSLQAAVGGYIEPVTQHRFADVTLYVNEEGLMKNLPPNTAATIIFEYPLVGNVVMVANTDEMNKEFEHEADEADDARVPYLHPLGTLAKSDDETDNVLSPLDDMMDRHRERLESKDEEPPRFYERLDNYDPAGH